MVALSSAEVLLAIEIGNYYELTRERVRQIKERAIRRLRGSRSVNLIPFISQ